MITAKRVQTSPGDECPSCHNGEVQHSFSSLYTCSLEVSQQLYATQSRYGYKELHDVQSISTLWAKGSQYNVTNLYMATEVAIPGTITAPVRIHSRNSLPKLTSLTKLQTHTSTIGLQIEQQLQALCKL